MPECWNPLAEVCDNQHIKTLKYHACLTRVYGASCIVTCIFTHTHCKLCIPSVIRTKTCTYKFVASFTEYSDWKCRPAEQSSDEFISMAQLISSTFDTSQMQILKNFDTNLFLTQMLSFGVLFRQDESMDPTSLTTKMGQPSQSHRNATQRWSMNF